MKRIQDKHLGKATILSFALIPLSGFATDIYLPSLPAMAASLHVTSVEIQASLLIFLVSSGVSQMFVGSLLDSYGRYRPARLSSSGSSISPRWSRVIAHCSRVWR